MVLNELGQIVERCWLAIPQHFPQVELDVHVIMPNHVHGLLTLADMPSHQPLGVIVGTFKAAVTRELRENEKPLWQERYHDHIVRDEASLQRIRAYILGNPSQWMQDSLFAE
ncbi:MAG: transposase [Anaerolineae bacterium]|nr:transposase [Anaerolineae bacterium]